VGDPMNRCGCVTIMMTVRFIIAVVGWMVASMGFYSSFENEWIALCATTSTALILIDLWSERNANTHLYVDMTRFCFFMVVAFGAVAGAVGLMNVFVLFYSGISVLSRSLSPTHSYEY
jgi:hypothetical protein